MAEGHRDRENDLQPQILAVVVGSLALATRFLNVLFLFLSAEPEKTTYTWVYVFVSAGILIFVLILCISWKQVSGSKAKGSPVFWRWLWESRDYCQGTLSRSS